MPRMGCRAYAWAHQEQGVAWGVKWKGDWAMEATNKNAGMVETIKLAIELQAFS
jgi:hypothetical protein